MYKITRTHEIDAGHRVCGHSGKCQHFHGHRYKFDLTCQAEQLDELGMVVDFSVIKARLCQWLEDHFDHRMLLWQHDPMLGPMRDLDHKVVALPVNPTAENLAQYMVDTVAPVQLAGTGVALVSCTVHETTKCSATYEAGR